MLDDNGKCALTAPEAIEALDFYKKLAAYAPAGILNAADEQMRELFLNGTLAIELWPALEQPTLDKSKIDWDLYAGFAPKGKKPVGTYGGWNLVLYKGAKNQDAAWKFIQFMTREDVNGAVVDLIPANVAAAKTFLAKSRRHPEVILEHLNNAKPRPLSPHYLEVSEIQQNMVQKILLRHADRRRREGSLRRHRCAALGQERAEAGGRPAPLASRFQTHDRSSGLRLAFARPSRAWRPRRQRRKADRWMAYGFHGASRDPRRRAHVLADDRHLPREPLHDELHQPQADLCRTANLSPDLRRRDFLAGRAQFDRMDGRGCVPAERRRFPDRASAQPASAFPGGAALACAAPMGAAGGGGGDSVALHVRPAARPHQFVPHPARA